MIRILAPWAIARNTCSERFTSTQLLVIFSRISHTNKQCKSIAKNNITAANAVYRALSSISLEAWLIITVTETRFSTGLAFE